MCEAQAPGLCSDHTQAAQVAAFVHCPLSGHPDLPRAQEWASSSPALSRTHVPTRTSDRVHTPCFSRAGVVSPFSWFGAGRGHLLKEGGRRNVKEGRNGEREAVQR